MAKQEDQLSKGKSKKSSKSKSDACVEKGIWTALPTSEPATTNLVFTPQGSGAMTFHMVGCSGDPTLTGPGLAVAGGMASQIEKPLMGAVAPSFLYHLGDIAYPTSGSTMTGDLWNTQFYAQYAAYADSDGPVPIFSIAGNHDGNSGTAPNTEIGHFMQNMCGTAGTVSPDDKTDTARTESTLPYPYWRLDLPAAWIIGLYTNVANGGMLDDPNAYTDPTTGPQYTWFVNQLKYCKQQNLGQPTPKAILLALHYPPYNGTIDFQQRGDPTLGQSPGASHAQPVGNVLQSAFAAAGQIPDAIFTAHAHLYERLTITYEDSGTVTQQVPCFIVGCGGHTQLELMASECAGGTSQNFPDVPFDLFAKGTPPETLLQPTVGSLTGTVTIEIYADGTNQASQPYGFLTVTLNPAVGNAHATLACQFWTTPCDNTGKELNPGALTWVDGCTLDLTTHLLV